MTMIEPLLLQIDRAGLAGLALVMAWLSWSLWRQNRRPVHWWAAGVWGSFALWRIVAFLAWSIPGTASGWEHRYHISIPQTLMLVFMIGLVACLARMKVAGKG